MSFVRVRNRVPSDASSLENTLASMTSYKAIHGVLNGIELHDLQCIDVMKMLYSEKAVVIYDTGTGKTLLAAAAMQLCWNEDPSRKFIFFVKKDQLIQTPKKLSDACGKQIITSDASLKNVLRILSGEIYKDYSVLMLTHECLLQPEIMDVIFSVRNEYDGIIIDEAHELNNFNHASSATILSNMTKNFRFVWALTATPIVSDLVQLTKLAWIVDSNRYPNYKALLDGLKNGSFKVSDDPCFFINRNRSDFGSKSEYRGIVEWIQPLPHQKKVCGGAELLQLCKGEGAYPQAERLVELILERKVQRGLVYVNQHSVREWIIPFLQEAGIRFACINGKTNSRNRKRIMCEFNEEKTLDVVLTSVTTAIDLDCDYVIFYEFTVELKQMIGRAHRGLGNKKLDVIFMITDDTSEIDYFYENGDCV